MDELRQRAAGVRLLVLDVDGVLTDGRLYFGADGEALKSFHVRDGHGIKTLRAGGVEVAIISGRSSRAVAQRAAELGIIHLRQGCEDKSAALQALLAELGLGAEDLACVGDDLPDLPLLQRARLAIMVADAHPGLSEHCHWRTVNAGGAGAVREVCDLILAARSGSAR